MEATIATLAGVIVGFVLSYGATYVQRQTKISALLDALLMEMERCVSRAGNVIQGEVAAPLYRLPMDTFAVCFPYLLSEAAFGRSVNDVAEFYERVAELNRGLDSAHQAAVQNNISLLHENRSRNRIKAKNIVDPIEGSERSLAATAIDAIRAQRSKRWKLWDRLT